MAKIVEKLNGNAVLIKIAIELFVVGIIFWQFCVVRDFPSTYMAKAEASQQHEQIKQDNNRQLDRIYSEIKSINEYLRGGK